MTPYYNFYRANTPLPLGYKRELTLSLLLDEVSRFLRIPLINIKGPSRERELVEARHIFYWLSWNLTDQTLKNMGKETGNRDHSTAISGRNSIEDLLTNDKRIVQIVQYLNRHLSIRYITKERVIH